MAIKACKVDLFKDLDKVIKLSQNKIFESTKTGDVEGNKVLKHYINNAFKDLKTQIKERIIPDADNFKEMTTDKLKGHVKRQILDILNQYKSARQMTKDFDLISKMSKDIDGVKGSITTLFQTHDIKANAQTTWFFDMLDNVWNNIDSTGKRFNAKNASKARQLFEASLYDRGANLKEFIKAKGVANADKELYLALKSGHHPEIPELDLIANIYKQIDDNVAAKVKEEAPYFNILKDHVMPLKLDYDKIRVTSVDEWSDFLLQHLDPRKADGSIMTEKGIRKKAAMIKDLIDSDTNFTPDSIYRATKSVFGFRKLHFKDVESEWQFIERFGRNNQGILESAMSHKQHLLKSLVYYKTHGPNVQFSLYNLNKHIADKYKNLDTNKITKAIDDESVVMKHKMGASSLSDELTHNIKQSLQDLVSYGLTGSSTLRNISFDQTINTGLNSHLLTGNNQLQETASAFSDLIKYSIKGDNAQEIVKLMERQGIMIQIEHAMLYRGFLDDSLSNTYSKNKDLKLDLSRKAAKFTSTWRKKVSKWSLADRTTKASRASQAANAGGVILDALENPRGITKATKNLIEQVALTDAEFAAFKYVDKIQYEGKGIALDTDTFNKIPDNVLDKLKNPLETKADVINRLKYGYQNLHMEMLNHLTAVTSRRGATIAKTGNPVIDTAIQTTLRFSNIGLSQWYNTIRLTRASTGNDPNITGPIGALRIKEAQSSIPAFARLAATQAVGGYMILWSNDLFNGKTPREISIKNTLYAIAASGAGGWLSWIYMQSHYNHGNIGTPLKSYIQPPKAAIEAAFKDDPNWETVRRNLGKTGQVWIPGLNMFYTKAAVKRGLEELGQYDPSPAEKRYDKDLGRKNIEKVFE